MAAAVAAGWARSGAQLRGVAGSGLDVVCCPVQFWSAKRLKWPIVTRAHVPTTGVLRRRLEERVLRRRVWGSVALSLCAIAHPLHTRFTNK